LAGHRAVRVGVELAARNGPVGEARPEAIDPPGGKLREAANRDSAL